jgi:hypothetical protein
MGTMTTDAPLLWMECFAGDARVEGEDVDTVVDRFVAHANENHDWPYPEEALRNYARNYAEANVRLTGGVERLSQIGEVSIHPVTDYRIDDWIGFFDHDAFAGNPDWASCYCLEPHIPATEDSPERPWRKIRATMIERLQTGELMGTSPMSTARQPDGSTRPHDPATSCTDKSTRTDQTPPRS